MKLTFLGTRGNIDVRNRRHHMHTSMMVTYYQKKVMVDCGEDWLGNLDGLHPHAIVITHAHPDHAFGLKQGAPCPVYATQITWEEIDHYPIDERRTIEPRSPLEVEGIDFEAFPVDHSSVAPAVGYRISAGVVSIFYMPDGLYIHDRGQALADAKAYIGDGATVTRSMVRKSGDTLIGHTPIRTQLTWCQKEGVPQMIVTHCGSQIVKGDERKVGAEIRSLAQERDVEVQIAHDGMEMILR
jgi:ribonuclease BN (tRNA processing enzyme)